MRIRVGTRTRRLHWTSFTPAVEGWFIFITEWTAERIRLRWQNGRDWRLRLVLNFDMVNWTWFFRMQNIQSRGIFQPFDLRMKRIGACAAILRSEEHTS